LNLTVAVNLTFVHITQHVVAQPSEWRESCYGSF